MPTYSAEAFRLLAQRTCFPGLAEEHRRATQWDDRKYKSHFKLCPLGCEVLWFKLSECCADKTYRNQDGEVLPFYKIQPNHLLWTLHYLKTYCSEDVACTLWGITPKTHRKYFWAVVSFLGNLSNELVRFNLFHHYCFCCVVMTPHHLLTFLLLNQDQVGT